MTKPSTKFNIGDRVQNVPGTGHSSEIPMYSQGVVVDLRSDANDYCLVVDFDGYAPHKSYHEKFLEKIVTYQEPMDLSYRVGPKRTKSGIRVGDTWITGDI